MGLRNTSQLGLEGGVEVLAAADGDEAVRVGQLGEHAHLVVVLKVGANHRHVCGFAVVLLSGSVAQVSNRN